jgi:hypothetical protein
MKRSWGVALSAIAMCTTSAVATGWPIGSGTAQAATSHVWFAAPNGSGSTCSQAAPCELFQATGGSTSGDTVILEPGTYNDGGAPYSAELDVRGSTFEGEPAQPMPVIQSAPTGTGDGMDLFSGSVARDFKLEYSGTASGLNANSATISQVFVAADTPESAAFSPACQIVGHDDAGFTATMIDSICLQTGTSPNAIAMDAGATSGALLRNVTALAPNAGGIAIEVRDQGAGVSTYDVINSIAVGGSADLEAQWSGSGTPGSATINVSNSAYVTTSTPTANASVVAGAGNIKARAHFTGATSGNFAEAAGSPTIDKGTASGIVAGETDLAGNPRTLGSAPDIGAYEALEKPAVATPSVTAKGKTVVKLAVKVNPRGLSTTVTITGTRHGHSFHTKVHSAGSGDAGKFVHVTVHGLKKNATYRFHAVARNRAGSTPGHTRKAKTK